MSCNIRWRDRSGFLFLLSIALFSIFLSSYQVRVVSAFDPKIFDSIVIDPGHGGEDTGCVSALGTKEKDLTLQIAKRLGALLQDRLGMRTMLTRNGDYAVDLIERTGMANNFKGSLLISLHINSSFSPYQAGQLMIFTNPSPNPKGGETLPPDQGLEGRENEASPPLEKKQNLRAVPWDEVHTDFYKESYQFSLLLEEETKKIGIWRQSLVKEAPLLLLKGANMPAVEIEIDFLSSTQGEERLDDIWYHEMVCEAIFRAITRYKYRFEADSNATLW